jgi:hypothetical protein
MKKKNRPKAKPKFAFDRDYEVKGKTAVYRGKGDTFELDQVLKQMEKRGLKKVVFK